MPILCKGTIQPKSCRNAERQGKLLQRASSNIHFTYPLSAIPQMLPCPVHFKSLFFAVHVHLCAQSYHWKEDSSRHTRALQCSSFPYLQQAISVLSIYVLHGIPVSSSYLAQSASKQPFQLQRTESARPLHKRLLTTCFSSYLWDGCRRRQKSSSYSIYHHCLCLGNVHVSNQSDGLYHWNIWDMQDKKLPRNKFPLLFFSLIFILSLCRGRERGLALN